MSTTRPKASLARRLLLGAGVLGAAIALAACGGNGIEGGADDVDVPTAEGGPVEGDLTISNWTLYIDPDEEGEVGTITRFERDTGVDVNYIEDINDNVQFFGKMRPQLAQGQSGGRSMFVLTDWMAKRMFDLGFLQKLDKDAIPNVEENLLPGLESPAFDPDREFSVPWQSGFTGIVVRKDLAPDIDSISDLFDEQYAGKVTFLTEMRDTVPLVMKEMGVNPEEASKEEWLAAIDRIEEAREAGQIRRFTGNDYDQDLVRGNTVAAMGWSGDAVQLQLDNENIEFVMPEEGCNLWSDNMVIPVGAPNTAAALGFMNYVYQPEEQAKIAAWVNFVTPVQGTKEVLAEEDPELAENQLIFPDDEFIADCTTVDNPPGGPDEEREVEQAFQNVLAG